MEIIRPEDHKGVKFANINVGRNFEYCGKLYMKIYPAYSDINPHEVGFNCVCLETNRIGCFNGSTKVVSIKAKVVVG